MNEYNYHRQRFVSRNFIIILMLNSIPVEI